MRYLKEGRTDGHLEAIRRLSRLCEYVWWVHQIFYQVL